MLVSMSMSKIQSARAKKTGVNLRRSLLVSKVLFRAKTAVMMAKYNLNRYQLERAPAVEDAADDIEDSTESEDTTEVENTDQQVPDIDDAPAPPAQAEPETDSQTDDVEKTKSDSSRWQANNMLTQSTSDVIGLARCNKRRASEVESAVASILTPPAPKRQCVEQSSQEDTQTHTPMDLTSSQVSSLVSQFSCGFTVTSLSDSSCSRDVAASQQSSELSQASCELSRSQTSLTLSDAFTSCSNQIIIKDALSVTSASPIALSV